MEHGKSKNDLHLAAIATTVVNTDRRILVLSHHSDPPILLIPRNNPAPSLLMSLFKSPPFRQSKEAQTLEEIEQQTFHISQPPRAFPYQQTLRLQRRGLADTRPGFARWVQASPSLKLSPPADMQSSSGRAASASPAPTSNTSRPFAISACDSTPGYSGVA